MLFLNNSVKRLPTLIIFGNQHHEETWHNYCVDGSIWLFKFSKVLQTHTLGEVGILGTVFKSLLRDNLSNNRFIFDWKRAKDKYAQFFFLRHGVYANNLEYLSTMETSSNMLHNTAYHYIHFSPCCLSAISSPLLLSRAFIIRHNNNTEAYVNSQWIIIGSDRRPETKQRIERKIDRFRSGRVRVRVRFRSPIWT